MKNIRSILALSAMIAALLLTAPAANADTLTLDLTQAYQSGDAGDTLIFDVNVTNTDLTDVIYLNSDSTTLVGPLVLDNSYFYTYAPYYLNPGDSSGVFDLFTVFIPDGTPIGLYAGTFEILGGLTGSDSNYLGSANFDVQVT